MRFNRRAIGAVSLALLTAAGSGCHKLVPRSANDGVARDSAVVRIASGDWQLVGDFIRPAYTRQRKLPVAILLNKAGGDRRAYTGLATALAGQGIASLRIDLRAHGESVNRGRFAPFDTSAGARAVAASLDSTYLDVEAARVWLRSQPTIDAHAIAVVGASYSAEAMARAAREFGVAQAYVALSPGSFSDQSLADVDRSSLPWLFVVSRRETFVRRQGFIPRVIAGATTGRLVVVPDSAHATDLLTRSPLLEQRIASWLARALRTRPADPAMLDAARAVSVWLKATHTRRPSGASWPDDALRPEHQSFDLASGVAGQVLFFAEFARVTGDTANLGTVREGADILLRALRDRDTTIVGRDPTLYTGLPGVAIALSAAHSVTRDARYAVAHDSIVALVHRSIRLIDRRPSWTPANDVMFGDAGTGLFLLSIARERGDTAALARGAEVARTLVSRAMEDSAGLSWKRLPTSPYVLPNFSHGAAGTGMYAALAGDLTNDSRLREAGIRAARYLVSVARNDSLGFRVPYGWPLPPGGWARPVDIGWAHGPAGTARIFWQLWQTTRDPQYLQIVLDCVRAIRHAGLFGLPRAEFGVAPFGNTMRFDLAGVADFLADVSDVTGNPTHLGLARQIADSIRSRGESSNGGLRWVAPRHGFMTNPGELGALTGYAHGAAGYGLLFLKIWALEHGRVLPVRLPDNPF